MVDVIVSSNFEKQIKHLDFQLKDRLKKLILKVVNNPLIGKPLKYGLKGERSLRLPPFRVVYSYVSGVVYLLKFDHRKDIYKQ